MGAPRFKLHVWANTYSEVTTLGDTIKTALNNFSGWWKSTEVMHVAIRNIGDMPVERSEATNKVI